MTHSQFRSRQWSARLGEYAKKLNAGRCGTRKLSSICSDGCSAVGP